VTKSIKTTDDDGFVTIDTEYVRRGETGEVVETMKASDKLKNDIEKEKEDQKTKKKTAETLGSDVVLHNNPYAAVKKAAGLQSPQEIQHKVNKQKGAQRNADNNVIQQEKGAKAPAPPPPPPKQKPKKQSKPGKSHISDSTSGSEPSSLSSSSSSTTPSVGVNPQPVLIGAFALAIAVLSYVFLLS